MAEYIPPPPPKKTNWGIVILSVLIGVIIGLSVFYVALYTPLYNENVLNKARADSAEAEVNTLTTRLMVANQSINNYKSQIDNYSTWVTSLHVTIDVLNTRIYQLQHPNYPILLTMNGQGGYDPNTQEFTYRTSVTFSSGNRMIVAMVSSNDQYDAGVYIYGYKVGDQYASFTVWSRSAFGSGLSIYGAELSAGTYYLSVTGSSNSIWSVSVLDSTPSTNA